jgi:glycosyltransferase involved in cell wall biosynthesis
MVGFVLDDREGGPAAHAFAEDVAQLLAREGQPTHLFRLVPTPVHAPRLLHSLCSDGRPAAKLDRSAAETRPLQTSRNETPRLEPHELSACCEALAEQLVREAGRHGVRVLHAIGLDLPAAVARLVHRAKGLPYFLTPSAADLSRDEPQFANRARAALLAAREVVLFDEETPHELQERFDLGSEALRLRILPSGTDLATFKPLPRRERPRQAERLGGRAELRARLEGIDWTRSFVVLAVEPRGDRHGFERFLFALPELIRQQPQLQVVVVGEGGDPLTDGLRAALAGGRAELLHGVLSSSELCQPLVDHLGRLQREGRTESWWAAAARLEPERRVRFLGWVSRQEFAALLGMSDLFVLPASGLRPPSRMFHEALACGVLPVAGESSGIGAVARRIGEEISAEIASLCVLRNDAQPVREIEEKIGRIVRLRPELSERLRGLAEEAHDGRRLAAELRRLYALPAPAAAARAER